MSHLSLSPLSPPPQNDTINLITMAFISPLSLNQTG
jgi:hypothetical protein